MSAKKVSIAIIGSIIVISFTSLGVISAIHTDRKFNFEPKVKIEKTQSEIQKLDTQYTKLDNDLDKAAMQKQQDKVEIEKYNQQKADLEKQREELKKQLQAKAEKKSKLAAASEKVINAATNTQKVSAEATPPSLESIILAASKKYNVSYDMMIRMATCESTMGKRLRNPEPVIVNGKDYGHAEGVYQFIPSTWTRMSAQAGYGGVSVYDAAANVNTFAWAVANGHKGEWACQ